MDICLVGRWCFSRALAQRHLFYVVGHTHSMVDQRFPGVLQAISRAQTLETPEADGWGGGPRPPGISVGPSTLAALALLSSFSGSGSGFEGRVGFAWE